MIRIAVVDDDCYLASHVERVLLAYNRISTYDFEIEVFSSGYDLFQYLEEEQNFDLIFLDIEMEGCNGVEIGRILRDEQKDNITQIVYITACDGYERQLFQIRPMNFLEKPLSSNMIVAEVEKYIELFAGMEQLFSFTCQRKNLKIPYKDIIYFRSDDKKIEIYTTDKEYIFYGKLNDISKRLPHNFIIIHKSYVVNRMYIQKYNYDSVIMTNNDELPISQNYRKDVRKLISQKTDSGKEFFHV